MQLQKLEIFGFKSFKNKTVLEFQNDGITGIVGPNGCGKSNIVDAFLWVMGETAPKNLRSSSLNDVIFSGTHEEAPSAMAEVSLTLSKENGGLPEKYKNFSEIMITRRSFREGKTEYFINQQACLLRDIKEIFMDTGAGCRGFSIIEQESIERLITAKPQERRFIIEEVAGITKFKTRKQESKRKIELVKQNLKRLDDVLKSQEKQLNSLSQQAKKAEKYRELKKDIKGREVEVLCRLHNELSKEQESLKQNFTEQKTEKARLQNSMVEWEANLKSIEKNMTMQETTLEKDRDYLSSLNYKIVERQKEIEKIDNIISIYNKNMEAINKSKTNLLETETNLLDKQEQSKKELAKIEPSLLENYDSSLVASKTEKMKSQLDITSKNRVSKESQLSTIDKQVQFIEREQNKIKEEKRNSEAQLKKSIHSKNKIADLLEKNQQMKFSVRQDLSSLEENTKILDDKNKIDNQDLGSLKQEISLLKYKTEELKKLTKQFESLDEGSYYLSSSHPESFKPLFKNLKIEPEFEQALVAALGLHAGALVSTDTNSIEQGIEQLKKEEKGKSSFISSLPTENKNQVPVSQLKKYPAFLCYLEEKITFDLDTDLLKSIICDTVVVNNLSAAIQLKQTFPSLQFVTKEGDLVTRESIIYAGSNSSGKESNLFQLRNQIEKNSKDLQIKQANLTLKQARFKKQQSQFTQMKKELDSLKNKNTERSQTLLIQKKDLERLESDSLRLTEYGASYELKLYNFEQEKKSLIKNKHSLEQEIAVLSASIEKQTSQLNNFNEADNKYKSIKMEILQNSKDQASLEQKINLLANLVMQSRSKESKDFNLSTDASHIIEQEKTQVKEVQKQLNLFLEEKQQLEQNILSKGKYRQENKKNRETLTLNLKNSQQCIIKINLNENSYQSDQEKLDIKKQNINEKLLDGHQFNIGEDEFVAQYESTSLDSLSQELVKLKEKLEKTSTVNLLAITEYEEISKENKFLTSQKEDLINSKKDLLKVISHIDKICETRFLDMLEEINSRFSKIFPLVFEGENAEARLVLHQDENCDSDQEPGLDIIVRPPGKKVQSVTLLSRGEKALTSICLIYALFLVKPSPFCIVDEIDSPLDDANIFRLISVLNEMARKSQIVTITHNKYTMKACKKLYGVTMEKLGVSQIVSVDMTSDKKLFEQMEESL